MGENGSGKTNLLSIIADALFEAAAKHFEDTVPHAGAPRRPWFRMAGGPMISFKASGSATVLGFEHGGAEFSFFEKAGKARAAEVIAKLPESLKSITWTSGEEAQKDFGVTGEMSRTIFEEGMYAYFPSSRAEVPHWLNRESVPSSEFPISTKITKRLNKPIFVDNALRYFVQWVLAVMMDARIDFLHLQHDNGQSEYRLIGDPHGSLVNRGTLALATKILRQILGKEDAEFVWLGRHSDARLGVFQGGTLLSRLEALSAGQGTLLSIFGTILRYADIKKWGEEFPKEDIGGICLRGWPR